MFSWQHFIKNKLLKVMNKKGWLSNKNQYEKNLPIGIYEL